MANCNRIDNHIWFSGDIDNESSDNFCRTLYETKQYVEERADNNIVIHLHTDGGGVMACFKMFDQVRAISREHPISFITEGWVASAGTILICAAPTVISLPRTRFLVHELRGHMYDVHSSNKRTVAFQESLHQDILAIYKERTTIGEAELATETYLTAPEALKAGLITEIAEG